ncbi:MAG: hypothetical protein AAGD22_08750 [Verrucomicrobiota bacterium]
MESLQDNSLGTALLGDGTPLLLFTGLSLVLSGVFALFLASTGEFLPQDSLYLQMTARALCGYYEGRILDFMVHDRAAFGGSIIAVGSIYMWLAYYPLREGEAWAWWVFLVSGILGFGSFLAYLGYGYLDRWHAVATTALLPVFIVGLVVAFRSLPRSGRSIRCLFRRQESRLPGRGEILLLLTSAGMIGAGLTILFVGMTSVFVPQDLEFIGATKEELNAVSPNLIPLIAHDRAGFGGGLATTGIVVGASIWCGKASLSRWQVLFIAGFAGFGCAIGVHYVIGYTDFIHLAPAWIGFAFFMMGIVLHRCELQGNARADRMPGPGD